MNRQPRHTYSLFLLLIMLVVGAIAAMAAQDPGRVMRDWRILNQEEWPQGVYIGLFDNQARIRMADGSEMDIPVWRLEGRELAYVQRQLTRLPDSLRVVEPPAGTEPLVDLRVEDLADGTVAEWGNAGRLGGVFRPLVASPAVRLIDGRRAVEFEYGPAVLSLEPQSMVADVAAPPGLGAETPVTVAAWVYSPGVAAESETVLSWHAFGGDNGTDIRYGAQQRIHLEASAYYGPRGGVRFPVETSPEPSRWHHVAWVIDGDTIRLYANGEPVGEKVRPIRLELLPATDIGPETVTLQVRLAGELPEDPARVGFWMGRSDGHHWRWGRGDDRWDDTRETTTDRNGVATVTFDALQPGTDYYFRATVYDGDRPSVWTEGPGRWRTAGADGTPGEPLPRDEERMFFLGSSWGSMWDWVVTPRHFFSGALGGMQVYDRALSLGEIRRLSGLAGPFAPAPADGAVLAGLETELHWQTEDPDTDRYRVYLSTDRAQVEAGHADTLLFEGNEPYATTGKLALGANIYWRVLARNPAGEWVSGAVWAFQAADGAATEPSPAPGETGVSAQRTYYTWTPGPFAQRQIFHFGRDAAAVARGEEELRVELPAQARDYHLQRDALTFGDTYYWRVEQVNEEGLPATAGTVWSFATEDFVLAEFDGPVSEPYPWGARQWGWVTKYMEGEGHPIIAADDTPDEAMRVARYSSLKILEKRPDLRYYFAVSNTAGSLELEKPLGWTEMVRAAYGATVNMLLDPGFYGGQNMFMHEMGHQVHMNAMSKIDHDMDRRLRESYDQSMETLHYLGTYDSSNMWEYIAVAANRWVNDSTAFAVEYPREALRRTDPHFYRFLKEYWSADRLLDLRPRQGLEVDGDGLVLRWENSGGIEYWDRNEGWSRYAETVGTMNPVGAPQRGTPGGVPAVVFGGRDALVWTQRLRDSFSGDHSWSLSCWVRPDEGVEGDRVLFSRGDPAAGGMELRWGGGGLSIVLPDRVETVEDLRPEAGRWQYLAVAFDGDWMGAQPGVLTIYLNGERVAHQDLSMDLAAGGPLWVGGSVRQGQVGDGWAGAISTLRFYDYDMHPLQVAEHYLEERPYHHREPLVASGLLLADLDARHLKDLEERDHHPAYPESLHRPWVRSWANRGALGGRVHNNVWRGNGSAPVLRNVAGVEAVLFQGKDLMASAEAMDGVQAVEAWVYRTAWDLEGTVLEIDTLSLPGALLEPGAWRHVAAVRAAGGWAVYVDGQPAGHQGPAGQAARRLHLGAHWDGVRWTRHLQGAIAQVRLHGEVLTPRQIRMNRRRSDFTRAMDPAPADGSAVVAARGKALDWQAGPVSASEYHLYMGTDREAVAAAGPRSPLYQGLAEPGAVVPPVEPGTPYYWRVDAVTEEGERMRGRVWSFTTVQGEVLALSAEGMEEGPVSRWENRGRAGGVFLPVEAGARRPEVLEVDGRRAVVFDGPETILQSDGPTPESVTGSGPFTIEMLVYNPDIAHEETVFSLAPEVARERFGWPGTGAVEVGYGRGGYRSSSVFYNGVGGTTMWWTGEPPPARAWHHIAWVYDGEMRGAIRVYVNGELAEENLFVTLETYRGFPMVLGSGWNTQEGVRRPFSGALAALKVYDYALTEAEIREAAGK